MGFSGKIRSGLKKLTIALAGRLPNGAYKRVVHSAPPRLLRTLSHPSLRSKYETGESLPKSLWGITANTDNHMEVQQCDCVDLARHYKTPLFVVTRPQLEKNYRHFVESFRRYYPQAKVGYSYKTNPLPDVLTILHDIGAWAEVVSPFELALALKLKVPPEKIIYNGPGKSGEGLDLAVSNKIKMINVDGFNEIQRIAKLTERHGHMQSVGVRVVTPVGWKKKFGFSIKSGDALKAYAILNRYPFVKPCGMHIHLGTGVTDVDTYLTAIKSCLDFANQLQRELGIDIRFFDFGGGFDPVSSVRNYSARELLLAEHSFPVQEPHIHKVSEIDLYGRKIGQLFRDYYNGRDNDLPEIIFEPGRAITSNAQFLLLKVLDIKPSEGGIDAILDGGRNVASPTVWECHAMFNASRINASETHSYTLYGPLCTPYDSTFQIKRLPPLERNDILALMDTGAYFISSLSNFCSFPKPAAIMIEDGQHKLIRRRETFWDLFNKDAVFAKISSSRQLEKTEFVEHLEKWNVITTNSV